MVCIKKTVHSEAVVEIKFSAKYQYLATLDDSYTLCIWYWDGMTLESKFVTTKESEVRFEWHPWKVNELVVAETLPAKLSVIDVSTRKVIASYTKLLNIEKVCITAISFNKLTAELLVSLWYKVTKKSEILVLSSMDRVVDVLEAHDRMVFYLIWSPNGKILGKCYSEATEQN